MKRTSLLALIFILLFSIVYSFEERGATTAHAQAQQGEVTASSLFVRADAASNARIIGGLQKGAKVEIHATKGDWHQIRFNNGWGHIHKGFVKTASSSSAEAASGTGEVTAGSLRVRSGPSTSHRVVGSLSRGQKVDITATSGDWLKIKVGSSEGFVHGSYINTGDSSGSSEKTASSSAATGEITASSLNVRSGPSTSNRIVGSLSRGDKVDLQEKSGDWYKISSGYIHSSFVNTEGSGPSSGGSAPEAATTKGEVTANSLNVRSEPSTSSSIVGSLTRGTQVDIHEQNGNWYTIKRGNGWAYVHASYVREVGTSSGSSGSGSGSLSGKTIFLDPGHGGRDPGAVVQGNIYEKTIALNLSQKVRQRLEAEGARVVMSRTGDSYLSGGQRVAAANQSGADLFISIHANAFPNSSASGAEVLYSSAGKHPNDSRMLALELQSSITDGTGLRNRGTVNRSLAVLTGPNMPSVLIEPGFMTNSGDLSVLLNEQDKLASNIVNGLKRYYQ
ncbi:SH3 domain-containing protein [Alkalicoccus luteus]|uniref:SH3 domain-containing protein n=1 Tax=Alkalicoccus luteus TaxID=1237094 RepID=A0A969TUU4_9BACI|nr:SH3 domain-containing protein [Alkalicoccus luteus]